MNAQYSNKPIGLAEVRKHLELSRNALALRAGVTPSSVYKIEAGERDGNLKTLCALAQALCCEPADLLSIPTAQRLAEIKVDYLRTVADEAEAALQGEQKGVASDSLAACLPQKGGA